MKTLELETKTLELETKTLELETKALELEMKALKAKEEGIKEGIVDRVHLLQRLLRLPTTPQPELLTHSLVSLREIAGALERQAGVPEAGA